MIASLKLADTPHIRTGKGSFFMSEQFTLEQSLGNCRAVDGQEGGFAATAMLIDRSCNQFLSRATFAENQHIDILWRDPSDLFTD